MEPRPAGAPEFHGFALVFNPASGTTLNIAQ